MKKLIKHKNGDFSIVGGQTHMEIIMECLEIVSTFMYRNNQQADHDDLESDISTLREKGIEVRNYFTPYIDELKEILPLPSDSSIYSSR